MAYFALSSRKRYLIDKQFELDYKLLRARDELNEAHSYSTAIGDAKISLFELSSVPTQWQGRLCNFMRSSEMYATDAANADFRSMVGNMALQQDGRQYSPEQMDYMNRMTLQNLYIRRMQEFKNSEDKQLNEIEKNLKMKVTKIEQEKNLVDKELETIDRGMEKSMQDLVPRYA